MGYEVIDNFLSEEDHDKIYNSMLSAEFPWYFNDYPTQPKETDTVYNYQFTHMFYLNNEATSQFVNLLDPIYKKLGINFIHRIKANLSPATPETRVGRWHTDFEIDCKTAVYYVNTNNGFTKFRSGEIVESLANRIVIFDSLDLHVGATATDVKARCLINFNYS